MPGITTWSLHHTQKGKEEERYNILILLSDQEEKRKQKSKSHPQITLFCGRQADWACGSSSQGLTDSQLFSLLFM